MNEYEVFHVPTHYQPEPEEGSEPYEEGWFYWYCLPGCLPDSEPYGPFATEAEAEAAVQEELAEDAATAAPDPDDDDAPRPPGMGAMIQDARDDWDRMHGHRNAL